MKFINNDNCNRDACFLVINSKKESEITIIDGTNAEDLANEMLKKEHPEQAKTLSYESKFANKRRDLSSSIRELSHHNISEANLDDRDDAETYFHDLLSLSDDAYSDIRDLEEMPMFSVNFINNDKPNPHEYAKDYNSTDEILAKYCKWKKSNDKNIESINYYKLADGENMIAAYKNNKAISALINKIIKAEKRLDKRLL